MDEVNVSHLLVAGDGEHIDVVDGVADHLALADEGVEGDVFPLHLLGLLEAQFFTQTEHLVLEVAKHLTGVAFQDFTGLKDVLLVVFIGLFAYARTHAFLNMVVEADLILTRLHALLGNGRHTGTRVIELLNEIKYGVHRPHMGVGTEVGAPFLVDGTGLEDAGQVFVGDADGRVGLAILQEYVIAGVVFLDEGVLQE